MGVLTWFNKSVRTRTLIALISCLGACADSGPDPRRMTLEGIRPRDPQGLYLNEEIVLTFSSPVDATSVSEASLAIAAEDGTRARGEWIVSGQVVRFVPAPVLTPDLTDGGYRPGTRYQLQARGFPSLDGLRAQGGAPLERGFRWAFETVAIGEGRHGPVFDDVSPDRARPLVVDPRELRSLSPWQPLLLRCAEPLDPSTLRGEDFRLRSLARGEPQESRIPLAASLRENHPEDRHPEQHACTIELIPLEALTPGRYELTLDRIRNLALTDFHGNPVPVPWRSARVEVIVVKPPRDGARRPRFSFLDATDRSTVEVPWADGLARWEGTGAVEVRYPAAAGDGSDQEQDDEFLSLRGTQTDSDQHGISVHVPPDAQARFAPGHGLRVLRAQRRLAIEGELTRTIGDDAPRVGPANPDRPFAEGETLSEALERAAREGWDWTILIAGGDLSITGRLQVDTPLLLVAGGRIRASGDVRHEPLQLWLLGEGGGPKLDPAASFPDLVMDPPRLNPLVEPLHLAVVSSPVPSRVQRYRWRTVGADGHHGGGRWSVGFLPSTGPVTREEVASHPALLEENGPVRVLVELQVFPGGTWDPPFVDFVDLDWEAAD